MNYQKANPDMYQLLLTWKGDPSIKFDNADIKSSSSKKLLGVWINNKLTFNEQVSKLSKKQVINYMLWLVF